MANKRLRNGKRYGFVRFKNVVDIEMLYKALQTIWIDKYKLQVFKAEDRKHKDGKVDGSKGENRSNGGGVHRQYQRKGVFESRNERDEWLYSGVVCNYNMKNDLDQYEMSSERDGFKQQEEATMNKSERLIEVEPDELMNNIMERTIISKVKKIEFLEKIYTFIQKEGLENVLVNDWRIYDRDEMGYYHGNRKLLNVVIGRVMVHTMKIRVIQEFVQVTKGATKLRINVVVEVRDLVEVEMKEEVRSDLEDDMEDLMEDPMKDGECDREGGVADQPFPKTVGNMTVDEKNSGMQGQTEERGTQLRQGIEMLVKNEKFENIHSLTKNKRAGHCENPNGSNNINGPNDQSGLIIKDGNLNNDNGPFYSEYEKVINQVEPRVGVSQKTNKDQSDGINKLEQVLEHTCDSHMEGDGLGGVDPTYGGVVDRQEKSMVFRVWETNNKT
ncbi:transposon TX1 [Tanacetum coccineum]